MKVIEIIFFLTICCISINCSDDMDDTIQDSDGDTISNTTDNCINIPNQDQLDTDGDGIGDACDTDDDGDGILDTEDNCPISSKPKSV